MREFVRVGIVQTHLFDKAHRFRSKLAHTVRAVWVKHRKGAECSYIGSKCDVVDNRFVGEEGVFLRHVAAKAIRLEAFTAIHHHSPERRPLLAEDQTQEGGLAASRSP